MMNKIAPDLSERVPEGWKVVPLRWYLTCKSGESIDSQLIEKKSYEDKNIPVIGGNGIMGYSNKVNTTNKTLSIGRVGALCGNVHYINYPCWITDNSLLISSYKRSEIDLEFLKLILEQLNLNQYSTSTAQPLITGETIKKRKIALPSIEEQNRIVAYVNKKIKELDIVINCKSKIIELLEEKRQAMITEAVTKGLNSNVKMKDSGVEWIGMIPEHWASSLLKRFTKNITDGSHFSPEILDEGYPYITVKDIQDDKVDVDNALKISEEDYLELSKNGCAPTTGDILLSKDGTIGKVAIVNDEGFVVLSSLAIITPNELIISKYFSYWLKSKVNLEQMYSFLAGAALKRLTLQTINKFKIVVPPIDEQIEIVKQLDNNLVAINNSIGLIKKEIKSLKQYRQSLIYEAVTGKVDVRDIEVEK